MIVNGVPIVRGNRLKRVFFIVFFCSIAIFLYKINFDSGQSKLYFDSGQSDQFEERNYTKSDSNLSITINLESNVNAYYDKRKNWTTSNLGSILLKNNLEQYYSSKNRTFVILIWKYWNWLKIRHSGRNGASPFDGCSVNNCIVIHDDEQISTADAVIIHTWYGNLPATNGRRPCQRWVFLSDESPVHMFTMASKKPNLTEWANVFNWSMTYRSESDIPVPYGRTVPRLGPHPPNESITSLIPHWEKKKQDVYVAGLMSRYVRERMDYVKELQKYTEVDIYGKCSDKNLTCPGHFLNDCPNLSKYNFYLSFENSKCHQYLTEKVFYNAYSKGAIPIIMGAPRQDCADLLPPHSFLHVNDYENPKALAEEIIKIMSNEDTLLKYHEWRNQYEVLNEHGFSSSKSYHFCRICEALNYNDESPKTYDEEDLKFFLDPKLLCNLPDKN